MPDPFPGRVGILPCQCVGQVDFAVASGQVLLAQAFDVLLVLLQGQDEAFGHYRCTILLAFAVSDDDLALGKVKVFDPQPQTFH